MADKLEMMSSDLIQQNINYISDKFPNALKEVRDEEGKLVKKIDFDILKQELSSILIDDKQERYQMTWPDKKKSVLLANSRINATLRPIKEKSVDFDNTQNLYIEGDNLDVLKLLRETYLNKVKMIYIDPPYNTGNDFVYEDDFAQSSEEYLKNSGQFDNQGNRLFSNNESNGRFHTDWLNMMYPRLILARDLLADDGVMFISIDDNEVENLIKIGKEVFGDSNYINALKWKRKKQPSFLSRHIAPVMEYILIFARDSNKLGKLSVEKVSDSTKKVINISNLTSKRIFKPGVEVKELTDGIIKKGVYTVKTMQVEYENDIYVKDGRTTNSVSVVAKFLNTQDKINEFIDDGLLFITAAKGLRRYVSEEEKDKEKSITDLILDWGDNQDSEKEQKELFGAKYFDYTKPVALLHNLIMSCTDNNDIVMDFFSGSGTTAHATLQLNSEDYGERRFIMVQLPEKCDPKSEAYKAGYSTICDIGEERIRRAGNLIRVEWEKEHKNEGLFADENEQFPVDIGFRVLKLDSSNMNDVYYNPNSMNQTLLDSTVDNVKPGRTGLDLLFQVMLELGVELSAKIEEKTISGKQCFVVNENDIVACFDDNVTDEVTRELAQIKPIYAVFKDSSFDSDSSNINCEQIFKSASPTTTIKVI